MHTILTNIFHIYQHWLVVSMILLSATAGLGIIWQVNCIHQYR